jgi:hypothetical protein
VRTPNPVLAAPSHDETDTTNPKMGDKMAALRFINFHVTVKVIGTTAEETRIPITRYRYPIEIPAYASMVENPAMRNAKTRIE